MTFLPFLLNRSRLPICSYNLFLFWRVTLKSVKKKSINMLLLFFSILACNTSNTKWLIYSRSQHLTRLANDFPVFLLNRSKLQLCYCDFFFYFCRETLKYLKKKYFCMYIDKKKYLKKKKKKYLSMYIDEQNQ